MTASSGVIGIGYEGSTLDEFLDALTRWEVSTLVDVRLNPISRKRGFSKNALAEALRGRGIEYRHARVLGNPRDNRAGYAELGTPAGDDARAAFAEVLADDAATKELDEIVLLARNSFVAVLCYEQDERHCHRHQVLAAVRERLWEVAPV